MTKANGSKAKTAKVASNGNLLKTKAETSAKRSAQAVTGPVKVAKQPTEFETPCLCGCGNLIHRPGSRFRQGHDAALKGYLQRHYLKAPRSTDPTLEHLAANFAAATGETVKADAEAILVAVNPAWSQFLDSAQMRQKAEKLVARASKAATAVTAKAGKAVKAAKVATKEATQQVRRMIGSIIKTGTVEGGMFKFINGAGNPVVIPLGKTKAAPSA